MLHWISTSQVDKVFIVVKKNLITNWYEELCKHSFILSEILTNQKSINTDIFLSKANVIILSYEIINKEVLRLENQCKNFDVAFILDESAKIKNPNSVLSKNIHYLADFIKKKL